MEGSYVYRKPSLLRKLKFSLTTLNENIIRVVIVLIVLCLNCTVAHSRKNNFEFPTTYLTFFTYVMLIGQQYNMRM